MKTRTAQELLQEHGLPLSVTDSVRLVMETCEELGEAARGAPREMLMVMLRRILREGVRTVRARERSCSFREAAWASYEARVRKGRRSATLGDLRHFIGRMLRVEAFGEKSLRTLTTEECRAMLESAFGGSVHSYRKGRAVLHSIFAYGMRREWCDGNPVCRIEVPKVQEKEIKPLSIGEVKRLEKAAEMPQHREMRFSLALMLYCGIRPTEVSRLEPRDISHSEKCVFIRPQKSKTGGGRRVPLRKADKIPPGERTIPDDWLKRWRALRRDAGFRTWVPDRCRHTFATYHAYHFKNLPLLQLEMGHRSTDLLRTRYLNLCAVRRRDAGQFWR